MFLEHAKDLISMKICDKDHYKLRNILTMNGFELLKFEKRTPSSKLKVLIPTLEDVSLSPLLIFEVLASLSLQENQSEEREEAHAQAIGVLRFSLFKCVLCERDLGLIKGFFPFHINLVVESLGFRKPKLGG